MNYCQHGHASHATKTIAMPWGPFLIYDWRQYWEIGEGFCPGRDDVSRTLDTYGTWESQDTERWRHECERDALVIDVGSHIGWYTVAAALAGRDVLEVEWDSERREIASQNIAAVDLGGRVGAVESIDLLRMRPMPSGDVILKSDVEGAEDQVIDATRQQWQNRQVAVALLEVSPVFADYYPALIAELEWYGYRAELVDGTPVGDPAGWEPQFNCWMVRT